MKRWLLGLALAVAAAGAMAQTIVDLDYVLQAVIAFEQNWIDPDARNKLRRSGAWRAA